MNVQGLSLASPREELRCSDMDRPKLDLVTETCGMCIADLQRLVIFSRLLRIAFSSMTTTFANYLSLMCYAHFISDVKDTKMYIVNSSNELAF